MSCIHKDLQVASKLHLLEQEEKSKRQLGSDLLVVRETESLRE